MKTNVTILQEKMMKMGQTVDYDYIPVSGPPHAAVFTCQARALGAAASGSGRSKREAKQEAARRLLEELDGAEGGSAPALPAPAAAAAPAEPEPRTYVALLRELCEQYGLGSVDYQLLADTGPAHARQFSVSAALSGCRREASAHSKKLARQRAARALYDTVRALLPARTQAFDEEAALERAHERAMERYTAVTTGAAESLTLRVADWCGALAAAAAERGPRARELAAAGLLDEALEVLELRAERAELAPLVALSAAGASAPLCVAARDEAAARAQLARYLVRLLRPRPAAAAAVAAAEPGSVISV